MTIQLRLLGPMQLGPDDAPIELGGAKQRAVLALLAANYGQAIGADRLADAIWREGSPPAHPRRTIQLYVSNLRRLLRARSLDIVGNADGYRLDAERSAIDILVVEDHIAVASAHRNHDPAASLAQLRAAERLWRGPAYLGLGIDELDREAERVESLRVGAAEERLGHEVHTERRSSAIAELRRFIDEHPYRETAAAHLMTGLYLEHRHPEALRVLHALRERLADIGLEASPSLGELELRILRHELAVSPLHVSPAEQTPNDSLSTPTGFTPTGSATTGLPPITPLPGDGADGAALSVRPRLPAPIGSLIGRGDDAARATALLSGDARLLTIVGPGGSGKTRLALDVAWKLLSAFDGDVTFAELVGVHSIDEPSDQRRTIASVIAGNIGIPLYGRLDALEELGAALAHRSLLVVLDNCEHLSEAAAVTRALLEAGPKVHVLATSREPLGLRGESLLRLDGLAVPPIGASTADEDGYASVDLFVERARQHTPDWTDDRSDGSVARLCQLLDGMPLAIELAAQWVGHFSPAEIAAEIAADLDFLATTSRDVPDRQRSPRAVFDYSWRLLDAAEQQALMQMSVFRGMFDAEAARHVAGVGPALLRALVERSFVRSLGAGRYSMHELLRQLSAERLVACGAENERHQQHATYYASLAEQATSRRAGLQQPHWLTRLDGAHDNLRAALAWADSRDDGYLGLRLASALWRYWEIRSHLLEGRRWLERFIPSIDPDGSVAFTAADDAAPRVLANALYGAGWLSHLLRDFNGADRFLSEGLAVDQASGRAGRVAWVLTQRAMMARSRGDYLAALRLLEESIAAAERHDDHAGIAAVLFRLAMVTRELGDFTRSVEVSRHAIEVYRRRGDRSGEGLALLALADNARDMGDSDETARYSNNALAIGRELDQPWITGYALHNLSVAALARHDCSRATEHALEALELFRARNEPNGEAEVLVTLGNIHLASGRTDDGHRVLLDGLRLAAEVGPYFLIPTAIEDLASASDEAALTVRMISAIASWREAHSLPQRPSRRSAISGTLHRVRKTLGERDYEAAWHEGAGWSIDRALSTAIALSPARRH